MFSELFTVTTLVEQLLVIKVLPRFNFAGVSSVVLQKQIKDLHQEQKVLRDTGNRVVYVRLISSFLV